MNAWEIVTWGDHPAVIVSHPHRVAHKPTVEVLSCSTQRAVRRPEPHEVVLDQADGLDWETLCRCDLVYAVEKAQLSRSRGLVSLERRRHIVRTILASHAWTQL